MTANANEKTLTYASSNAGVVSVDNNGVIKANALGTATITVTASSGVKRILTVTVVPTPAASVTLNKTQATLKATETVQLTATILPVTTTDKTVKWTTSDSAIATVDANGNVTAGAVGDAMITATCGTVSATCAVTVVPTPAASISLNKTEATLIPDETVELNVTILPETTTDKTVSWTSSNESVAVVDANGIVTAKSVGTATITATCGTVSATCAITVKPVLATGITLDITDKNVFDGEDFKLTATVTPENTTDKTVIWSSSDEDVVTVDQEGNVHASGVGTATITATCGSVNATCAVTVKPLLPTFVATDKDGTSVKRGASVAEDKAPVTVVITNPYPGEKMNISVMNTSIGTNFDYESTEATYTVTFPESAEWTVGVMLFIKGYKSYAEFNCTIEGEVRHNLYAPYVEFLDEDDNTVESPSTQLPLRMVISNQNYYEGVKMVYTINGEETETGEHTVEIELTEPGKIDYSVYCKLGKKSLSTVTEGSYMIEVCAAKLAAPEITFTTPEGEIVPVTCTITNPNLDGYGTIVYAIGTSQWFETDDAEVTFTLPFDGTYTVKAYVRNNEHEDLSSDISEKSYEQVDVPGISFGGEEVTVRGGEIIAPEGAEIYTIGGIRMANGRVAPGIYIVRTAKKTVKVVVK